MSSMQVRCPKCGGNAHWNSDDDVTYCDEPKSKCGWFGIADPEAPWRSTRANWIKNYGSTQKGK